MKTAVRILVIAVGVSFVGMTARPYLENAWFLWTLAVEKPPATLGSPLAARRTPRFVDRHGAQNPYPRLAAGDHAAGNAHQTFARRRSEDS